MSQIAIRAALEVTLQGIGGPLPSAQIVSSTGGVFTTSAPHGLTTGLDVKVLDHSTMAAGKNKVVVLSPTTFKLTDKVSGTSVVISNGSGGTVEAQLTAWDNVSFDPMNGVPYEKVNHIFARPSNPAMGDGFYRENGFMQVTLCYPEKTGSFAAMSRAELIRNTFPRGSSFSNNGITVKINKTPEILQGGIVDQIFVIYVRVPFYADIYN